MKTTTNGNTLAQKILKQLEKLPDESLVKVADFVIELLEQPSAMQDETKVSAPFLEKGVVDLRERGINHAQAAGTRALLATFAEDWDSPEMSVYDNYAASQVQQLNISAELLERAKDYLAMVDEPDGHTGTRERNAERTAAHERLMDEMEQCNIPFHSRFEARWIARWLVAQHQPNFDSTPSLLWAKPNGDNEWFKEIRHVPPEDNKEGWIPVVVTLQPLSSHPTIFERNHS